ncbi:MAG: N-(5-phosphoribosyl)anthranilate isomerase [Bacteroidetes bacterium]|nr:N-(5-phosphoribosyl)anthranilate isomerase [Bacteroidota bacterium]
MKLKVCGLKYSDNIRQVAELNPDYMGFIFYEGSKRFVGEDFVMPLISESIRKAGVFVNASEEYILEKVKKYGLSIVQLHGDESPEFCQKLAIHIPVIKAFGVDENFKLEMLEPYFGHCSFFLFDNKAETFGGSAQPFNWEVLINYNNATPYFIAGGMDLERFRKIDALKLNVYGVDVNSRIEIKPGYKDIIKVIQFRNNIR